MRTAFPYLTAAISLQDSRIDPDWINWMLKIIMLLLVGTMKHILDGNSEFGMEEP